jgi:hypothetical protein
VETAETLREDIAALREAFDPHSPDSLQPPLGWAGVRGFEAAHGVVLPEPYRTFVAEVCDGCAAGPPDYGLVPLSALPADHGRNADAVRELAKPFPLTAAWPWDGGGLPEAELDRLRTPVFDHGSIVLGTDGCGMDWHLVVTGPHRGHVWLVTGEGAQPFGADFGCTTGAAGFAGWVRHWAEGKWWFDAA